MPTPAAVLVLTTVPSESLADEIASALVNEKLAACVSISGPITSVYRWEGRVERQVERQLVIKTTRERLDALLQRVKELHSYEVPELMTVDVTGGGDAYLNWIGDETRS